RMPDTANALMRGTISEAQAIEVARGAAADPNAEGHLLRQSQWGTVKALKAETDRVVARATDHGQAEQDKVHKGRFVRHHVARDGAFCLEARLTKVAGAKVVEALEHYAKIEFETARSTGVWAHHTTYLADGLVAMCEHARHGGVRGVRGAGAQASAGTGRRDVTSAGSRGGAGSSGDAPGGEDEIAALRRGTERSGPLALVEVRVDHAALVRGRVEGDEVCEIEGLGPIPVAEAQRLASDSILRVLLVDGGVVKKISSTTRSIPPRLKRVIVERDRTCVVPGCDVSWNLEIDHRIPFAQGGRTDEENLARLCHEHHRQKTAGKAILERWEDDRGRPRWAWHPTTRPNEPPPLSFEERWPNLWTG
ncbi:MAG: HNH endonuclease signature motif containing protein, partial [Actinomycetes bacterium]